MSTEDGGDQPPLMLASFGTDRRRRRSMPMRTRLMIGAGAAVAAVLAAVVVLNPRTGVMDALSGATPSLTEAKACLRQGDLGCAEADFRAYLHKYPNDASANAILAITLTQDGHHEESIGYYKHALALGVATYDLYANYAVSLNTTGKVDDAIKMNYAALQLVPQLVDVRGALADQLVRKGRRQEALNLLESFDRTLQEEGQSPYFESQIARIQAHAGPPAAAVAAGPPVAGREELRLEASGGSLYVPAEVDGALTLRFVVDSGATDLTIPADVARTLERMGKLGRGDYLGQGTSILADGSRVASQVVMIRSLKVGGHEVRNIPATVTDARGVPLLGQSFLRRLKSWSIDNRRHVLVLEG